MRDKLHAIARDTAATIQNIDRKQLRFNDIVDVAVLYYSNCPEAGVKELVQACDRDSQLYVKGAPMWEVLRKDYRWML